MSIESKIKKNVPLKPLSTFKIGGNAKFFLEVKDKASLEEAIRWADEKTEKVHILAGGSNILINDEGVDGLVLKMANDALSVRGSRLLAGAGAILANVVNTATSHSLSGLENLAGIPGSLGGAIRGNAGAFGHSIDEAVETIEAFDAGSYRFKTLSRKDCQFSYRNSIFKENRSMLAWEVTLKLSENGSGAIKSAVAENLNYRTRTHPKLPSAGCVFTNLMFADVEKLNPGLAERAKGEGIVKGGKVAAGWLIDQLDLKGQRMGGVKISLEHANHIVNTGQGRAEDVVMLISYVKQQVRDNFNIILREEIEYFGF